MSDIEAAFEEHFRYVYLYILKLSRDEALAEEITSESFLKALSSIDSFKGDCDIRVWLCQIAKNCYFTHRKKFQREYTLERPDISGSDCFFARADGSHPFKGNRCGNTAIASQTG